MTGELRRPVNPHPGCCDHFRGKRTVAQVVTGPTSGECWLPWCTKYNVWLGDRGQQSLDACCTGGDCPLSIDQKAT